MPAASAMDEMTLHLDNGSQLHFRGRLFSEAVWYDEDSGVLTHQKLYVTDKREHVYVIQKSFEGKKHCRAYRVSLRGDRCAMFNGRSVMEMPLELLLQGMKVLCGAEDGVALEQVEESLRSAGC